MPTLLTKVCPIVNVTSEANIFISHYIRVSELYMSYSDHDTKRQFKKRLKALSVDCENCAPLQMSKLLSAIKKNER